MASSTHVLVLFLEGGVNELPVREVAVVWWGKYVKSTKNSLLQWEPEMMNTTTFSKVILLECMRMTVRSPRLFGGSGGAEEVN